MTRLHLDDEVVWQDKHWVIEDFLSLEKVRLRLRDGSQIRIAPISEFQSELVSLDRAPILLAPHEEVQRAQRIYEAIEPLIKLRTMKRAQVEEAATKIGCVPSAIYQYLRKWEKHQRLSAFMRKPRSDKGKSRLDPRVKTIIDETIETYYKTEERRDVAATVEEIRANCDSLGLPLPSLTPVLSAIRKLPEKERSRARYGRKRTKERYEPYRGSFPGADFPQAVYQIDHTPADVILVDDETRNPIGRAYLTIVLDVCTRMLAGFCVTLEAPSAMSAALALSHAILPKDEWLRTRNLDSSWPIWGVPRKVHADNAKEFRGSALTRGCSEYGITLENRPRGQPQYGGHVERSFRTFMKATQRIKGTTFSNVAKKLDYDSQGKAIMTLAEYERWFAIFITYRYHNRKQRAIGHPPLNFYEKLVRGTDTTPPIGLPEPIADPRRLLMDFLPFTERTVQQTGVEFERIHYWEDVLRKWIGAKDDDQTKSRKFVFAYDPRDISALYFLDPDSNTYTAIPYRNKGRDAISIWELQAVQRVIDADPSRKSNESAIFEGVHLMREQEAASEKATNKTRRKRARSKEWKEIQSKKETSVTTNSNSSSPNATVALPGYSKEENIEAPTFDDIDQ